ncbi:MAG: flagellar export protein FliJ [Planctomycetes bacterium]|nr:flagellar export protein FliJ [Planctomycetota bacterium]
MKAFAFPLDPVLRYRRQVEDDRKRTFGLAHRAVREQEMAIVRILSELETAKTEMRNLEGGAFSMREIAIQQRHLRGLELRLGRVRGSLPPLLARAADARAALLQATKDREVIERLRVRRLREWNYAASVEEQKSLDEIALGVIRRTMSEAEVLPPGVTS